MSLCSCGHLHEAIEHICQLLSLLHAVQALMRKYMPFAVIIGIILFVLWARRAFY